MNETVVIEAIRKTVTVDLVVEEAFRLFTTEIDSWWPKGTHSLHGDTVREVVFEEREGGEVYELTTNGEKGHWATVLAWEPPGRLVLAWEVSERTLGTEVELRFSAADDGTRVELEHRGWERAAEADARAGYDTGWDAVLETYAERLG